jgi:hypothetical protein
MVQRQGFRGERDWHCTVCGLVHEDAAPTDDRSS